MVEANPDNFVLPGELHALGNLCEALDEATKALMGDGALSIGDVPIFDANGEGLGKVTFSTAGKWAYDPW